jgi:hypothetical protein
MIKAFKGNLFAFKVSLTFVYHHIQFCVVSNLAHSIILTPTKYKVSSSISIIKSFIKSQKSSQQEFKIGIAIFLGSGLCNAKSNCNFKK